MNNVNNIQNLLQSKAEYQARLNLIPYKGTVEIKEISGKKYLYIRKRENNKLRSTYVGLYSEELHQLLLKGVRDARVLERKIKNIEKELDTLGYSEKELQEHVLLNLEFARVNMKQLIYDQAILEGIATTFPDTERILENAKISNISASDVQKILNLKHAWEFILNKDVIQSPTNYYLSQHIAKLVNQGFFIDGGRIRVFPVTIGGTSYIPKVPYEHEVKESIDNIISNSINDVDTAINLILYMMKSQIFNDGNKRTAIIFANHYLIGKGKGLIIIPDNLVEEFRKLLINYYEGNDTDLIKEFLL
ncbi:MAG: cell filamentation protein Fic, partial [Acholeplasmataceae bacterium]|nr:cell filamentation protein Fic [Acholeplasmataceae bacterium]